MENGGVRGQRLGHERLALPQRCDRDASDGFVDARNGAGRQCVWRHRSHLEVRGGERPDRPDVLSGDDHRDALRADVIERSGDATRDDGQNEQRPAGDQSMSAGDRTAIVISASSRSSGATSVNISKRSDQRTPGAGIRSHSAANGSLLPVFAEA